MKIGFFKRNEMQKNPNGEVCEYTYNDVKLLLESEYERIHLALKFSNGSIWKASKILNISERTLHRKIIKYKIDVRLYKPCQTTEKK